MNLHPDIQRRLDEQEKLGGVQLDELEPGTKIEVQTLNTLYTIEVLENGKYMVSGGSYFSAPTETHIGGSTWGSSMLKLKWLGINMHIEMGHPAKNGIITTSPVQAIKIIAPDGEGEYEISDSVSSS